MAARGSGGKRRAQGQGTEDTFVLGIARTIDWAREHQRGVILGALAAVVLIGGLIYYRDYRRNLTARAATQLSQLEGQLGAAGGPDQAISQIQEYLSRFSGTPSADEARLLLARIQLDQGRPSKAIEALDPLSGRPLDTPTGYAAARLRADAHTAAGQSEMAIALLDRAARGARFAFQRHAAASDEAELLVQAGRYDSAASIYRGLMADSAGTAGQDNLYAVRLGQALALAATDARPPEGPPLDTGRAATDTTVPGGLAVPESAAAGVLRGGGAAPGASSPDSSGR